MASIFVASSNFGHRALVRGMLLMLIMNAATSAAAMDWPQEIVADEVTIVVYQPQPDKLEGNVLSARAAMSLEADNLDEPIFGAFWFDAKIDTDRDDS